MNSGSNSTSNIPVLTEVISLDSTVVPPAPASNRPAPVAAAPVAAAPAAPVISSTPDGSNLSGAVRLSDQQLEQLEKALHESVLRQLLARVDFVLEHRVRDGLADVLQTSVEDLARDIRSGLAISLEEMVKRTISQELSKIQSNGSIKS